MKVMLAHNWSGEDVVGWWASEKLDGMRAIWIPTTRGRMVKTISWADEDRIDLATGLWSRLGKVIMAPDEFLDKLPKDMCLDGELWTGRGEFQRLMTIVKRYVNLTTWHGVSYKIFDIIPPIMGQGFWPQDFKHSLEIMKDRLDHMMVEQVKIKDINHLHGIMDQVVSEGGEGLMLRHERSVWSPGRSKLLLKMKKLHDDEGEVIGYNAGEGRLTGMVGSLIVRTRGVVFNLSGLTDEQRVAGAIPIGTIVTYKYREYTLSGVPKEARFWRIKSD